MDDVELDTKNLDNFIKALKDELPRVYVGILGDKSARSGGPVNNATIGLYHEFGTEKMPKRSFLRQPLGDHLKSTMDNSGVFDADAMKEVIRSKSVITWLKKLGVLAEGIIKEGFNSNGYGKWKPHAPGYHNNTGNILVDTQQLRDSITSEVI